MSLLLLAVTFGQLSFEFGPSKPQQNANVKTMKTTIAKLLNCHCENPTDNVGVDAVCFFVYFSLSLWHCCTVHPRIMEVFQTDNYYIFVKKEKSLWWHRITSEFTIKAGKCWQ